MLRTIRNRQYVIWALLAILCLLGFYIPFNPTLVILQFFYFLIPLLIVFILSLLFLIGCLFFNRSTLKRAWFPASIIPLFIASQILSVVFVDRLQRFRSNRLIAKIQSAQTISGKLPPSHELWPGIQFTRQKDERNFKVEYTRGFLVTEEYLSLNKSWISRGWND